MPRRAKTKEPKPYVTLDCRDGAHKACQWCWCDCHQEVPF